MKSPVAAIIWEIWRKNRWGFLAIFAGLAYGFFYTSHAVQQIMEQRTPIISDFLAVGFGIALGLAFFAPFVAFTYSDLDAPLSFPRRTFTKPVSTKLLVNTPILLGMFVMVAVNLTAGCQLSVLAKLHYPSITMSLYWIAALLAFQAIVWCFSDHEITLSLALAAGVAAFVWFAALLNDGHPAKAVTMLVVTALASYCASWMAIDQRRKGEWETLFSISKYFDATVGWLFHRRTALVTPAGAQFWIEYRRNATGPLASLFVIILFYWLVQRVLVFQDFAIMFALVAISVWAGLSGVLLARDPNSKDLGLSTFLATRPISNGELVIAKIKVAGVLTVAANLATACMFAFWVFYARNGHFPLRAAFAPGFGLYVFCILWLVVGAMPIWLMGYVRSPAVGIMLLLAACPAIVNIIAWFESHHLLDALFLWGAPTALALKLLVATWAFRKCLQRRLLSLSAVVKYATYWAAAIALVMAAVYVLPVYVWQQDSGRFPPVVVCWLATLLVPLARVGLAALALTRARNQ